MVRQIGGKELSFNNLLDLDSARRLLAEYRVPACVIVKHNNPCGTAVGETPLEAYTKAFASDPQSAFGGIVVLNRDVDDDLATALVEQFIEVLFAPGYTEGALEILSRKEKMRVLENQERRAERVDEPEVKQVLGGVLVQDRDSDLEERTDMRVVTERQPTEAEWGELLFAWRVCKHVRSNAIVLAKDLATVGVGAGQMSRVDSVRIALEKAGPGRTGGSVLASDAYFPFADGPELAIEAGVTAIIQPGGSIRDHEVVEAADRAGIAMVFTNRRHFRH
jgi:phosphoribosylaminoimidazolecarboxamide formyltransferase/IMP cyclohydrolase